TRSGTHTGLGEAGDAGGTVGVLAVARALTWSIARGVGVPPPPSWATMSSTPPRAHPVLRGHLRNHIDSSVALHLDPSVASPISKAMSRQVVTYNRLRRGSAEFPFPTGGEEDSPVTETPLVAVIMGSKSDWETMRHADEMLTRLGVPHECAVMS